MILEFSEVHKHNTNKVMMFSLYSEFCTTWCGIQWNRFFSQHVKNEIWNQNSHKAYLSTPTLLVEKLFKTLTFGRNKLHLFISSYSNISLWTNRFDINKVSDIQMQSIETCLWMWNITTDTTFVRLSQIYSAQITIL